MSFLKGLGRAIGLQRCDRAPITHQRSGLTLVIAEERRIWDEWKKLMPGHYVTKPGGFYCERTQTMWVRFKGNWGVEPDLAVLGHEVAHWFGLPVDSYAT